MTSQGDSECFVLNGSVEVKTIGDSSTKKAHVKDPATWSQVVSSL